MFGLNLSSQEAFVLGIAALWVFSAAVGALEAPADSSSPFYKWAYRFLKAVAGDLGSVFGKYIPTQGGTQSKLPTVLMALAIGLGTLVLAQPAQAQMSVTTQATASAIRYQGQWGVGTEQSQLLPVIYFGQQNGQVFSLGAREIIAPTFGWSIYGALGSYQPDISSIIKKTTFNPDQFALSFDLAGGMASLPNNITKPAIEGRVNFSYAFTPTIAMTGAYAGGGLIGQERFATVSAGLAYVFGASNVPSAAAHRLAARMGRKAF
jgi:hypothetical protein